MLPTAHRLVVSLPRGARWGGPAWGSTRIAVGHEERAPASIAAAAATRVKAVEVLFGDARILASHDAPSYAVVMTGHFGQLPRRPAWQPGDAAPPRPGPDRRHRRPHAGPDRHQRPRPGHTGLLTQSGPVTTLSQ